MLRMQVVKSNSACALALSVVLLGDVHVHGGRPAQTQVVARKVSEHAHLAFIDNPMRMSDQEIAKMDTTGMVEKKSADLTFFAYPTNQDKWVSDSISPNGDYWEKGMSDQCCREYQKLTGKAHFLDVGANIGTWSIPMAQCLQKLNHGGSVIAVEALAANAMHLAASARANNFQNIDLFNYAVGDGGPQDEALEEVVADNRGGSKLIFKASSDRAKKSVAMTTLDAILRDRLASKDSRIFAMKMDIENYELYALRGAPSFLQGDHRPCLIFIELRVDDHEPSAKAMKLLQDSGYEDQGLLQGSSWDHLLRREDFAACAQKFASA